MHVGTHFGAHACKVGMLAAKVIVDQRFPAKGLRNLIPSLTLIPSFWLIRKRNDHPY